MLVIDSEMTATVIKILVESINCTSCLIIVLIAGWIIQLYNLSVLRVHIIEVNLTCVHIMLQLVKQITAAGAVSISQTNTITTGNSKALCLCMVLIHIMTWVWPWLIVLL